MYHNIIYGGTYWRHLANTTERSLLGGDAAKLKGQNGYRKYIMVVMETQMLSFYRHNIYTNS